MREINWNRAIYIRLKVDGIKFFVSYAYYLVRHFLL